MRLDVSWAQEMVETMRRAREITGLVCSAEEEQRASEEFMRWARDSGLRGRFYRTVSTGGLVVWVLKVVTARGDLETTIQDPRAWKSAMREMGLGGLL